jgi:hypothetical protein
LIGMLRGTHAPIMDGGCDIDGSAQRPKPGVTFVANTDTTMATIETTAGAA